MPKSQKNAPAENAPAENAPRVLRFGGTARGGEGGSRGGPPGAELEMVVGLDSLLKTRMLVQAASGGGKSYLARALLEGTVGSVQQIILDPEGEFVTLRERFPFVLASAGGEGDVGAAPESAAALCRGLLKAGVSAVADLSELSLPERRRFVRLFLEELMALERSMWRPLLVVLDEAHRFAPEKGAAEAESTDAVIALASQGRKRGFCLSALTQRLSKLHKDVAAELLNVFVGMTQLDVDVGRAADALGFDRKQRGELRDLEHEFFAHGPALAARRPERVRAGEVLTSHPEPGGLGGHLGAAPPAPQELRAVLDDLARSMEAAAASGTGAEETPSVAPGGGRSVGGPEPKRASEREHEREVQRRAEALAEERLDQRVGELVGQRLEAEVKRATAPLKERISLLERTLADARGGAAALSESIERVLPDSAKGHSEPESAGARRTSAVALGVEGSSEDVADSTASSAAKSAAEHPRTAEARAGGAPGGTSAGSLPHARTRILSTLRQMEKMGLRSLPRANLAVFAEQGPRSSAFRDHVAALKEEGHLEYPSAGRVALSRAGREKADAIDGTSGEGGEPRTLKELHRAWISRLPDAGGRIVEALVEAHPTDLGREELAAASGQSDRSSAFRDRGAELRSLGLVEYPQKGRVRASQMLFPDGLR